MDLVDREVFDSLCRQLYFDSEVIRKLVVHFADEWDGRQMRLEQSVKDSRWINATTVLRSIGTTGQMLGTSALVAATENMRLAIQEQRFDDARREFPIVAEIGHHTCNELLNLEITKI